jgi:uncharacterized protein (DUF2141 family)
MIRQQSLAKHRLISAMYKGNPLSRSFKGHKQLLVLLLVLAGVVARSQNQLIVRVQGISNVKGQLLYSLYRSSDGFPSDPSKAFKRGAIPVNAQAIEFTLESLPPGEYALSLVHDRNANGQLDMNALGVPTEEIGFSNNVMGAFGPPKFSRARFVLSGAKYELTPIRIRKLP